MLVQKVVEYISLSCQEGSVNGAFDWVSILGPVTECAKEDDGLNDANVTTDANKC